MTQENALAALLDRRGKRILGPGKKLTILKIPNLAM